MPRIIGRVTAVLAAIAALVVLSTDIAFADCTLTYQIGETRGDCGDAAAAIAAVTIGAATIGVGSVVLFLTHATKAIDALRVNLAELMGFVTSLDPGAVPSGVRTAIPSLTASVVPQAPPMADTDQAAALAQAVSGIGQAGAVTQAAAAPLALEIAEMAAIGDYTNTGYAVLNSSLRAGADLSARQRSQVAAIESGLAKLPDHKGVVYRSTDLPAEVIDLYRPGTLVVDNAFTSTALDPYETKAKRFDTFFNIYSTSGKNISSYSAVSHETEILFASGTRFEVLRNYPDPDTGKRIIDMIQR